MEATLQKIYELVSIWGVKVLAAFAIFIIGQWISKGFRNFFKRLMANRSVDDTIVGFIGNLTYVALLAFFIIAALGQLPADCALGGSFVENPRPKRQYPWGQDVASDRAQASRGNYRDTGIRSTSAVGCFAGGASAYGCEDLGGNVLEWTQHKQDVCALRGGAFGSYGYGVRCGARGGDYPYGRSDLEGVRVLVSPFFSEL